MIPITKFTIRNNERRAVMSVLQSGHIVEGPVVKALEQDFVKYTGAKYAIAVNSGTAALHASLYGLGIKQGDEVITTPFTFIATVNSILMVGATPIFVDINSDTYTLDYSKIEKAITNKTKAIITVDLYGQPADYEEIKAIAKKYKLFVIDDAAQAISASYKNKKIGNIADITCFSLYATKNIMCGEGGMITLNNFQISEKIKRFKNHGQLPGEKYNYAELGYNYRLTDIAGAIAREQFKKVDFVTKKRQKIASMYDSYLTHIKGITVPTKKKDRTHVFHQYTIQITKEFSYSRDELRNLLKTKGIQTEVYYPKPLSEYAYLHAKGLKDSKNNSTLVSKQVLSLPIYPDLSATDIRYICHTIKYIANS